MVSANETSPLIFDTDGDGLFDGLELGLTSGIADVDGPGPLKATEPGRFYADLDTTTNSDPRLWDTDADGSGDGVEDNNLNGRQDPGE